MDSPRNDLQALPIYMNLCHKTGKQRHASKGAAEAHLRAMLKRGAVSDADARLLNTYICTEAYGCGDWHVGKDEFRKPVEVIPVLPKMKRSVGLRYKKSK